MTTSNSLAPPSSDREDAGGVEAAWEALAEADAHALPAMIRALTRDQLASIPRHVSTLDARGREVERAVEVTGIIAGGCRATFLRLLLPLWERVVQFGVARAGVTAAASQLDWVFQPEADAIARCIGRSFTDFPELEIEVARAELAGRVMECGDEADRLYLATLALAIDGAHRRAVEVLLLDLVRRGDLGPAEELLRARLALGRDEPLLSRLLESLQTVAPAASMGLLRLVSADLPGTPSLTSLRLGLALGRALEADGETADPVALARAAGRVGTLAAAQRDGAPRHRRDGAGSDVARRLAALSRVVSHHRPRPTADPGAECPPGAGSHPAAAGGVTGWLPYMLSKGPVRLATRRCATQYGERRADGSLEASRHPPDKLLLCGPYVGLPAGTLTATFLGSVEAGTRIEFSVTRSYGRETLARQAAVLQAVEDGPLITLSWSSERETEDSEFTVRVLSEWARVTLSGIAIRIAAGP